MKHLRFLALAALVALPLSACSDDKKEPVAPITGTVSGAVAVEGSGLAGVSVALVGPTSGSATTAAGGTYSFTGVEAGSYAVVISGWSQDDVVFSTQSKTVTITTAGQVVTVDFAGSYIRTANISGNVIADGDGLAGVAVTMTGPEGAKNAVTDQAGHYSASGLRKGNYTVAITVPEGYTFANSSFDVSVGVGEAKEVSFFGEPTETVDPVTASVVIESVTNNAGQILNPNNIAGQINVKLNIDPGENDLQRVCILLNGAEVLNGCQTLGSAVAEGEMLQGILTPIFSVFTDDVDPDTGTPLYMNGTYELSAVLDLENAQESNVTTSMDLSFKNSDKVMAVFTPEFQAVVDGDYVVGGDLAVTIMPSLFSGKEVDEFEVCTDWDCFDVSGPFPTTETLVYVYDDYGFDDYYGEDIWVGNGVFTDGTPAGISAYAHLAGTDEDEVDFDYEPAYFDYSIYLTDQVDDPELPCCSQNWVGPDYMPVDGMDSDDPYDDLVGVDHFAFFIDAYDDLTDDDLEVLLDEGAIDFTGYATIAEDGSMADAALELSLNNDDYDLCAVVWDMFGQWSFECLSGNGESNDEDIYFGYDDTPPTNQTVVYQPPMQVIYNIAAFGDDQGGFNVSASEDRSGFSSVPFRGYIQWWNADDTGYPIADDYDDGGMLNLALPFGSCDDTGGDVFGGDVCYPDYTQEDGVYYITGSMNNQAGVSNATMIEGWVFNDQTAPEITDNVSVPFAITVGDPMTFAGPVHDDLHLGTTAFGFNLTGFADLYLPLGENIVNSDNDLDPWDDNFPTDDIAQITIDPAIVAVQLFGAPGLIKFNAVRAQHTDGAGNISNQQANNILATSVEDGTAFAAFTAWGITVDAVELCNGQGNTDCDEDTQETSVDLEIIAEGPAGTFANPFAPGEVYIYLRVDDGDGDITDGEAIYLVDKLNATDASITDEGVGGSRFYTWEYTLTSAQVSALPAGTNYYFHVMGVKYSTGTALLDPVGTNNIEIVPGAL